MSGIYFNTSKQRWLVRWYTTNGKRVAKQFATRDDAEAFVPTIADERHALQRGSRTRSAEGLTPDRIRRALAARTHVDANGCHIWLPKGGSNGYPQMSYRTRDGLVKTVSMHRASYELHVGPIPEGLTIDHLCGVPMCVNHEHMEPVTLVENNRRRDEMKAATR